MVSGRMTGLPTWKTNIKAAQANLKKRRDAAMLAEGEIDMTEAKKRTPVSPTPAPAGVIPGTLRASGRVDGPIDMGGARTVILSFGSQGMSADYAIPQHENPTYNHTTGQWKYLESVMLESRSTMAGRLAARIKVSEKAPA